MQLQQQQQEESVTSNEPDISIPVCGANLTSPVIDMYSVIDEITYNIGTLKYVENADGI